jgi:hypothetical protein
MMMKKTFSTGILATLLLAAGAIGLISHSSDTDALPADRQVKGPVILELFTS